MEAAAELVGRVRHLMALFVTEEGILIAVPAAIKADTCPTLKDAMVGSRDDAAVVCGKHFCAAMLKLKLQISAPA